MHFHGEKEVQVDFLLLIIMSNYIFYLILFLENQFIRKIIKIILKEIDLILIMLQIDFKIIIIIIEFLKKKIKKLRLTFQI
jgi:hypothetical protein